MRFSNILYYFLLLGMTNAIPTLSAQLPKTSLYSFQFSIDGSRMRLSNAKMLSSFIESSYINQPSFIKTNEIYVSTDEDKDGFTDIQKLNLDELTYSDVTKTDSISEFSPTLCPDNLSFTSVRIEKDGISQTLWKYPLDQQNAGKRLFTTLNDVGYHCWINEEEVALFRVGEPIQFSIANLKSGKINTIIDNIGRCIKLDLDGNILFVHKVESDIWFLKKYNIINGKINIITQIKSEDFEVLSTGQILSSDGGTKLLLHDIDLESAWVEIEDLSKYGFYKIFRLCHSRNKLVIVNVNE